MDKYLKHYFRLARLYCGPCTVDMPKAGQRRVDEIGVKAVAKLREIFRNEPKPGYIEVLAFLGHRWESGFARFEDRVAALTSPVTEGALFRAQAA